TVGNGFGSSTMGSALTGLVGGVPATAPPANLALPAIPGPAQEAQTLSASPASWSGSPTGYTYEWKRCDALGESCTAIAGASSSSYLVQAGDIGFPIRASVTASNAGGSATSTSDASEIVAAAIASAPSGPATQTLT